jgi:predicted alpha/beta-hydrolase family hydrolase
MMAASRTRKVRTPAGDVSVRADGDGGRAVLLAHGAGGDMRSEFMEVMAQGISGAGTTVYRFNFGYSEAGRKSPDRQPVLEETFAAVVDHVAELERGRPLVLGGKSMGGRIASHVVANGHAAAGLVFLGYPLHPPGKPERLRDEHLATVRVPILFVEGTRDPFCPLQTLDEVLKRREIQALVHVIDDGDHSFKVRKSSGRSTKEVWQEVVDATVGWIDSLPE